VTNTSLTMDYIHYCTAFHRTHELTFISITAATSSNHTSLLLIIDVPKHTIKLTPKE
jgi:hypothetical protein